MKFKNLILLNHNFRSIFPYVREIISIKSTKNFILNLMGFKTYIIDTKYSIDSGGPIYKHYDLMVISKKEIFLKDVISLMKLEDDNLYLVRKL